MPGAEKQGHTTKPPKLNAVHSKFNLNARHSVIWRSRYRAGDAFMMISFFVLCVMAGGWIANIVKLMHMTMNGNEITLLLRAGGIFVFPLGMVLGFL